MPPGVEKFYWNDLANVPDKPGIYAWYYSPEITEFDLEKTISDLKSIRVPSERERAAKIVRELLERRLFSYFQEDPYEVKVEGQLKPSYAGQLHHQLGVSASLVARLTENPDRLRLIRDVLEASAPWFASPLYMGMSDTLRGRLGRHKGLIEKFCGTRERETGVDKEGAGFARQIAKRRIPPERLFVIICVIESTEGINVDIENILNRIYYPILGRN